MTEQSTELTAEELLHLALHATGQKKPDKAISLLKRLLTIEPENGKAHYLMGALHAEIGMHVQAAEEMTQALELEPELHTARFQLGLLHLTSGNVESAEKTWADLDALGDQDPLFLFKKGMLHLVKDEFSTCVEALKAGIEKNTFNEDLNNDMRRVILNAENAMGGQPVNMVDSDATQTTASGRQILLTAYENKTGDDT